ncbi:MAG: carbonic anhydrase, partial [Marinosulfonomonas sp.]|nr:carbonic anhydrase [Marinosulfonomonas sp.]
GFNRIAAMDLNDEAEEKQQLEKAAVVISLENLMTFPFIKSAVEAETMSIHGLWTDIGEGGLQHYDSENDLFVDV